MKPQMKEPDLASCAKQPNKSLQSWFFLNVLYLCFSCLSLAQEVINVFAPFWPLINNSRLTEGSSSLPSVMSPKGTEYPVESEENKFKKAVFEENSVNTGILERNSQNEASMYNRVDVQQHITNEHARKRVGIEWQNDNVDNKNIVHGSIGPRIITKKRSSTCVFGNKSNVLMHMDVSASGPLTTVEVNTSPILEPSKEQLNLPFEKLPPATSPSQNLASFRSADLTSISSKIKTSLTPCSENSYTLEQTNVAVVLTQDSISAETLPSESFKNKVNVKFHTTLMCQRSFLKKKCNSENFCKRDYCCSKCYQIEHEPLIKLIVTFMRCPKDGKVRILVGENLVEEVGWSCRAWGRRKIKYNAFRETACKLFYDVLCACKPKRTKKLGVCFASKVSFIKITIEEVG